MRKETIKSFLLFPDDGEFMLLFNLLKEAELLLNRNLTDVTFQTLMNMAKEKLCREIAEEFDINEAFSATSLKGAHNSEVMLRVCDHKGSYVSIDSILRSRGKETFIRQSDFVDVQASPFVTSELESLFDRREKEFKDYVKELSNPKTVIQGSNHDFFMCMWGLKLMITEDQSLADQLRFDVVVRLVEILSVNDLDQIQCYCVTILSHARSDECSGVMKDEALPRFVKLMDSEFRCYMVEAVIALTRLAYARPDYVHVIIENNALGVAQKISNLYCRDVSVMKELAKFMVAVCRGQSLSLETFTCEEVDATLTILDDLLQDKINYWPVDAALAILDNLFQLNIISITRVMRACHALSYLSFERIVPIEQGTLKRLIGLTFHADYTIAGSALGVVGNIARWGSNDQIQYLAKYTKLLQSLGRRWLCCEYKLFQMEACQIISNLAARSGTFRKNMGKLSLVNPLLRLLEEAEELVGGLEHGRKSGCSLLGTSTITATAALAWKKI
ncbi:hypothetical protein POM88_039312 [Heracleum sosnowskyi]|uniref:Uncharacterized protein n=1 Tax=Heracleum sosnowskyi TaxID=360622 RepID=A0AAD8M7P4_9APIA|nr:hypothetical protein POM88_039312 [Heracleum sosnowskyi]